MRGCLVASVVRFQRAATTARGFGNVNQRGHKPLRRGHYPLPEARVMMGLPPDQTGGAGTPEIVSPDDPNTPDPTPAEQGGD